MWKKLSLLMITKNAENVIEESLQSVQGLADEIIVIDNNSSDKTVEIAKRYGAKVYQFHEEHLGKQRRFGLLKATGDWVLVLDSDERASTELRVEIEKLRNGEIKEKEITGYFVPFQNHFLGRPLHYGGENYSKLILFKKDSVLAEEVLVHEKFRLIKGKPGQLKHKMLHYSYRSLRQMYEKFTDYAFLDAKQKLLNKEKSSLKKIFLYPSHMFWARFIKDKGYKDGLFRIVLDLGFAYMELLSYLALAYYQLKISIN